MNGTHGQVPPRAAALVESLRALGYSLPTAIADIVDNSVAARASNVEIRFEWESGSPYVYILDDGVGMTLERLVEAMRLGGFGPLSERSTSDLGRFGLGKLCKIDLDLAQSLH